MKGVEDERNAGKGARVVLVTTLLATYVFTILVGIAQAVHNFAQGNEPIAWVFVAMIAVYGILFAVTLVNVGPVEKGGLSLYARLNALEDEVIKLKKQRPLRFK